MNISTIEACPACEGGGQTQVFTPDKEAKSRFMELSSVKYKGFMDSWLEDLDMQIMKCNGCGHIYHHTQPDFASLSGMYNAGVQLKQVEPKLYPDSNMIKSMYRLYRFTAAKGLPTQLLDYGSGNCLWTTAASVVGFQVTAYEPNIKRIKNIANKNFTIVQQLSELNGNRFDVINLEQVLEHTKDPYELLRGLIPYLKSRSLLRIAVPNIHHHVRNKDIWSMFPFDGAKMHIMSPYEHLHGFTNVSLQLLVKRAGFALDLSLATCRAYPLNTFRTIMGKLIPAISTTECLMRPNSDILGTRP